MQGGTDLLAEGTDERDLTALHEQLRDHKLDGLQEVAVLVLLHKLPLTVQPRLGLLLRAIVTYAPAHKRKTCMGISASASS